MTTEPCSSWVTTGGSATATPAAASAGATARSDGGGLLGRRLQGAERGLKAALRLLEGHAILRPPRPGQARLDRPEVELDALRIHGIRIAGTSEEPLGLGVSVDKLHARFVAARQPQVVERHVVDGKNGDRRAVLRTHVPERGAIGNRQVFEAGPEELDELSDNAVLAEPLGNREHEVGCGGAFEHRARQTEAEHRRDEHRDRLAEHGRLSLDAADTPAHHSEAVDHRRVGIGADQCVRVRERPDRRFVRHHDAGEVLEVHLVNDPGVGRHDAEIREGTLSPAKERVPLLVARELELRIQLECVRLIEKVHLNRMIDDELHRLQRVDAVGIPAQPRDAVAHGREIDHRGHAGEILQEHAGRREGDFLLCRALDVPLGKHLDVGRLHEAAILMAQKIFQQNLERIRQARDFGVSGILERGQTVHLNRPVTDLQSLTCTEAIHR